MAPPMGSEALTTGGRRRALPVLLAAALVVAPFALSLATAGERTLFGVLAPDAMYYLAIAKNAARGFFLSFNQETLTNGFQPLWQYLLALAAWLLRPGPAALLWGTFWTCLALVALGVGAAVWGVQARFGPRVAWAMPFLLLPGAFALLFEPAIGHASLDPALQYGFSVWAFVNGVESGLGVAAFGLLLATLLANLVRRGPEASPEVIFSGWARVWLAVIVLARLDDVFLFAGVAAAVLLCGGSSPAQRVRQLVEARDSHP